jgi:hypothetical protein
MLAGLLSPALAAPPASAGVDDFVAGCMAGIADFGRLPDRLSAAGYREVDPADGPPGPAIVLDAERQRLWFRSLGEAHTGLALRPGGLPFDICWHLSRPGENAVTAIAALQRRFPPIGGQTETGTEMFYGGFEQWSAMADGIDVVLRVSWGARALPLEGGSMLVVTRPRAIPGRI